VLLHVHVEAVLLGEADPTGFTLVREIACMNSHMNSEVVAVGQLNPAHRARKPALARVASHVIFQHVLFEEGFGAQVALELLSLMPFDMQLQLPLKGKLLAAHLACGQLLRDLGVAGLDVIAQLFLACVVPATLIAHVTVPTTKHLGSRPLWIRCAEFQHTLGALTGGVLRAQEQLDVLVFHPRPFKVQVRARQPAILCHAHMLGSLRSRQLSVAHFAKIVGSRYWYALHRQWNTNCNHARFNTFQCKLNHWPHNIYKYNSCYYSNYQSSDQHKFFLHFISLDLGIESNFITAVLGSSYQSDQHKFYNTPSFMTFHFTRFRDLEQFHYSNLRILTREINTSFILPDFPRFSDTAYLKSYAKTTGKCVPFARLGQI
jgi:hypothetical protein